MCMLFLCCELSVSDCTLFRWRVPSSRLHVGQQSEDKHNPVCIILTVLDLHPVLPIASLTQDPDQPIPSVVRPQPHPVPTLEATFYVALWALHGGCLCPLFFCFNYTVAACFTCLGAAFCFVAFPSSRSQKQLGVKRVLFSVFLLVEERCVFIVDVPQTRWFHTQAPHCVSTFIDHNIMLLTSLWRSVIHFKL